MTSEQMLKTKCPNGCWFVNVAKLGSKPIWKIFPYGSTPNSRRVEQNGKYGDSRNKS